MCAHPAGCLPVTVHQPPGARRTVSSTHTREGTMQTRTLGQGLVVGAEGLGCMGMSSFYGERDDAAI